MDSLHKITHLNIKLLKEHLLSKVSVPSNTITFYHFIVGAKAVEEDFSLDKTTSESYIRCRNHECSKLVENLLFNPEMQLSPQLIKNNLKDNCITIRQVLVLIDPSYKHKPSPCGLLSVIKDLPLDLTIEHNLEHLNINIKSVLEPIIVPDDINEDQLLEIIKTLKPFRQFYSLLVNILDCSSVVCKNIYANSIDRSNCINDDYTWIHITNPKCLLNDEELQYMPIIMNREKDREKDRENKSEINNLSLFTRNTYDVRWANYNDDSHLIDELLNNYDTDKCPYSTNLYNFIITLYKVDTTLYSLISLFKLWGFTTYTSDYTFNNNYEYNLSLNISKKEIVVNFSKLSFEDFATYWLKYKEFRELSLFKHCYDNFIFNKFINYFIKKYFYGVGYSYLGINPSIIDFIKIEACEIFNTLSKYFYNDIKYLKEDSKLITRESIKQYLEENMVNL